MENLVNPTRSELYEPYYIYTDKPICDVAGIWFVEREPRFFGLEEKISKLTGIIDDIKIALNDIVYEDKENLQETLTTKKNLLGDILSRYKKIEKQYIEDDDYFREKLFSFYCYKYYITSIFAISERRMYLSCMLNIQRLLKHKFDNFRDGYDNLRNEFFQINNYIIKIKKLLNYDDLNKNIKHND